MPLCSVARTLWTLTCAPESHNSLVKAKSQHPQENGQQIGSSQVSRRMSSRPCLVSRGKGPQTRNSTSNPDGDSFQEELHGITTDSQENSRP